MAYKNVILPIPMLVVDARTLSSVFSLITGQSGLIHPLAMMVINNESNLPLRISYDGLTTHDFLQPFSFRLYNFQNKKSTQSYSSLLARGTKIYISGFRPEISGNIYLSGFYQPTNN